MAINGSAIAEQATDVLQNLLRACRRAEQAKLTLTSANEFKLINEQGGAHHGIKGTPQSDGTFKHQVTLDDPAGNQLLTFEYFAPTEQLPLD